ncbi:MAG TPA: HNH endonuclease [Verrucomicrobiae bacterium]|nr:HNH endonuclease [Verrucomicrobiae bacterium]
MPSRRHISHRTCQPRCNGGRSDLSNLALACPGCNLRKSSKTTAVDLKTGKVERLFHPVEQRWADHFRIDGYQIEGLTAEGRATVQALDLNHFRRLRIREVERSFGLFPPNITEVSR